MAKPNTKVVAKHKIWPKVRKSADKLFFFLFIFTLNSNKLFSKNNAPSKSAQVNTNFLV